MWTMPGNGCDSVPHLRHVSSCSHIHSYSCYRLVGGLCKHYHVSHYMRDVAYSTGFLILYTASSERYLPINQSVNQLISQSINQTEAKENPSPNTIIYSYKRSWFIWAY